MAENQYALIVFPNAKINLGLHITGRRPDGFHNIETVFVPVPLKDALEVVHAPTGAAGIGMTLYGLPVAGKADDNLCVKAWQLLHNDFPTLPAADAHLLKHIPMGAGLGGGSADGAFMLRLLNDKFRLGLIPEQLAAYALQLGSDCPFFIYNQPCFARGRGEQLEPLSLQLMGWQLVLANPGIHVNTGWAFSRLDPALFTRSRADLRQVLQQPVDQWKEQLVNDFEPPVFEQYPAIKALRDRLYEEGAVYAAMSGSGSTIYGLFAGNSAPASLPAGLVPAAPTGTFRVMNL